jgi:alkanesulfonate monooxygenase SsuD/methylene tetrahydromethanopterin reductase-like flavin-dependent oxidoreductase (luciferase family)
MSSNVGVTLPTREALRRNDPALIARTARLAESVGFGSLWAGDSLLARPLFDPLSTLAHVAGLTGSVRLGTGVLLVPMRQPALTAQALASIDQLSGGRLVVGVGRGFDLPETRREFAAAGVPFASRTERLVDTIDLWRQLWSAGRGSIDREWCRLDDEEIRPAVAQLGGPPIWLAAGSPRALELVGRVADGWLPYPPDPETYREGLVVVRESAIAHGRDADAIRPAVMVTISIGAPDRAQDELARYVQEFYGYPLELVGAIQACAAGTADQLLTQLRRYWDAGARTFVLRVASLDHTEQQVEALGEQLLPALASWERPTGTPWDSVCCSSTSTTSSR